MWQWPRLHQICKVANVQSANLENKLCIEKCRLIHLIVQMKGNLSQVYTLYLSKKNSSVENLFANLFFNFEQNLHNSKFDAIAAIATFARVAKLVQIYFFVLQACVERRTSNAVIK